MLCTPFQLWLLLPLSELVLAGRGVGRWGTEDGEGGRRGGAGGGRRRRKGREEEQEERTGAAGSLAAGRLRAAGTRPRRRRRLYRGQRQQPHPRSAFAPPDPFSPGPAPSAAQCGDARPSGRRGEQVRGLGWRAGSGGRLRLEAAPGPHAWDPRVLQVRNGSGRRGAARRAGGSSALGLTHAQWGQGTGSRTMRRGWQGLGEAWPSELRAPHVLAPPGPQLLRAKGCPFGASRRVCRSQPATLKDPPVLAPLPS